MLGGFGHQLFLKIAVKAVVNVLHLQCILLHTASVSFVLSVSNVFARGLHWFFF